jgi:hypothetical protein
VVIRLGNEVVVPKKLFLELSKANHMKDYAKLIVHG